MLQISLSTTFWTNLMYNWISVECTSFKITFFATEHFIAMKFGIRLIRNNVCSYFSVYITLGTNTLCVCVCVYVCVYVCVRACVCVTVTAIN